MNKNLILICAGKDALHQRWEQLHLDHGFDLALLVYDGTVYDDPNSNAAKWNLHCAGM